MFSLFSTPVTPDSLAPRNEDIALIFSRFGETELTYLFMTIPAEKIYAWFASLGQAQQEHIYPLLRDDIRKKILASKLMTNKVELMNEDAWYTQGKRDLDADPNHAANFFFAMKAHNCQLTTASAEKTTYLVPACTLERFNFQPYKYQRKLMDSHVENIAKGIADSKMLYHPIIMAYNQNELHILDGQHRWAALRKLSEADKQTVSVQVDVLMLNDATDSVVMDKYRHINTNIAIEEDALQEEIAYVRLVDAVKAKWPNSVVGSKSWKNSDSVPAHLVIDSKLKEELQARKVLNAYMSDEALLERLETINTRLSEAFSDKSFSLIENKMIARHNCWLGVAWPAAVHLLVEDVIVVDGKRVSM